MNPEKGMRFMDCENLRQLTGPEGWEFIDIEFAEYLLRESGTECAELFAAAALVSRAVRSGHSCCDLCLWAGKHFPEQAQPGEPQVLFPELDAWRDTLKQPALARVFTADAAHHPHIPLVLEQGHRLYLYRYYRYECQVAGEIRRRSQSAPRVPELAPGALAGLLDFFQARSGREAIDWQQLAVFAALSRDFFVITGGPGTGKTTVVTALLALELQRNPNLAVALCAPTGKAQARLRESLDAGIERLHIPEAIKQKLRELPCSTIHSLLKPEPGTNRFRHGPERPLHHELIVVDESSMVSLSLMAKLLQALRPAARIVLLGDKDQLASVDAGSVLADICDAGELNAFPPELAAAFARQTGWQAPPIAAALPLSGHLAELTEAHRFAKAVHIGAVSRAIKNVTPETLPETTAQIVGCAAADFTTRRVAPARFEAELAERIHRPILDRWCYADLKKLAADGSREALSTAVRLLNRFKILCAVRRGPWGVENFNAIMRKQMRLTAPYAPGVPLMILVNHRGTGLSNGDIGLVWRDLTPGAPTGGVRVYFPESERGFLSAELPDHETVFAMTVHKSQGSGFTEILLVLPERDQELLTRELLYTGITRAEEKVELWATPPIITAALARKTVRQSGLADRLNSQPQ